MEVVLSNNSIEVFTPINCTLLFSIHRICFLAFLCCMLKLDHNLLCSHAGAKEGGTLVFEEGSDCRSVQHEESLCKPGAQHGLCLPE